MSTPPLSKNNSSSNLDLNTQTDQKQTTGSSSSSPSAESDKGGGNTWKASQGVANATKRPTLISKSSQPNLYINIDSPPMGSPHTLPVRRDIKTVNSTPTKLTSSNSAANTPISLSDAPSTPKTPSSSSGSTSVIPSPSEKAATKNELHADGLSDRVRQIIDLGFQKNYILKPEQLAHVMIAVEIGCGKKMESANVVKSILREPLIVVNYETASGVKHKCINITELFCEPFINHHLDQKKLDELLQKVMREFSKVGTIVTKLSEGLRAVEQVNHPDIVELMVPTMKIVGDYFFGSDMKLVSSKFPDPIKKLLLEIDHQVITWFEKTGGSEMKALLVQRKSALVGFISTFSFMTIWGPKLAADTKNGAGFYAKLSSYINSYLVNKIDSFVIDILSNQGHQPGKVKKYVDDYAKGLKLTAQSASKLQLAGIEKGSVLSSIKGLFSPRSTSTSHLSGASRATTDEDSEFNEEAARQSEMQRKRIVKFTEFAKTAGFDKISTEFFIFIRNKIIDLKAKDYNAFTKDSVAYCHQQLEAFKIQKEEKNTDPELFKKIEQSINSYVENLEKKNEEKSSELNSPLSTPDVSPLKKSAKADQNDEKNDATESSLSAVEEKGRADGQAESKPVSEKTESDSSTSVETEKSDD